MMTSSCDPEQLRTLFLLDPHIHFLNHGSFGACPRPVFEDYQSWQRELERQPVLFLGRNYPALDRQVREVLAEALHTRADNLALVPNATHGVNILAHSLHLAPGDEVLATDHEYGACEATWEFYCQRMGAKYVRQPLRLPVASKDELLDQFWEGVTPRTRVIFLSHITSPTALTLPVKEICARARQQGVLTIVDGAHAPGQIDLDLEAIGADFYTGNCHKWMLSPKGAGFLYARPEMQRLIEPLVVSWGYRNRTGSPLVDYLQWTGTHDPAAALAVPAAIRFMEEYRWGEVRKTCHDRLRWTVEHLCALVGKSPLYPLDSDLYYQMAIAPLPETTDLQVLKDRLYDEFQVEVPFIEWNGNKFVRVSVQGYNTREDVEALCRGLEELLPQVQQGR
ncbi:aminotransferase class V-fold PLP-dependent enzyme [Anaerolinea thermolimosa]|uniref:aminotransferase class V-fold PLP-dependent enzyme n=1 Tax=Anaerolinea thermolimosa TaxID=229919 RepID=UPI0007808D99|nr:aminotransferase class V-fold PLP-dependent enzyme [Anaerolinea thermolimosa]